MNREHVWQPYPFGEASLFQCSHCRVLAACADSVAALPEVCPGVAPRLPHMIRMSPTPYGKPRAVCLCCILPAAPGPFVWQCANGKHIRASQQLSASKR